MNNVINFPLPPRMSPQGNAQQMNPMQAIMNQMRSGMSPAAIIDRIGGPQARQARQIISGKNENQLRDIAMNMAKQRGVDLNALAQQLGVKIPG